MNDTIAAVSAAGGPIGIIRISGERAIEAISQIFRPNGQADLTAAKSGQLLLGRLYDRQQKLIDQCFAVVFQPPHTYTGEQMAELQCHGSPAILSAALEALFANGVRQAEPGEFTRRAFLHGKIGLSEAEAVHDLITARTTEAAQNAAAQVLGAVGSPIAALREQLLGLVAHFHAVVDFPEEEIDPILFEDAAKTLHEVTGRLYRLAESFARGRILREGVPCVILGRPNAGKSTLLNTLLGRERAIVSPIAGTTRDILEESVKLGQLTLRLTDTAGLRESADQIEQLGIARAMGEVSKAALVLAMFDGSQPLSDDDRLVLAKTIDTRAIAIVNKADLPQRLNLDELMPHFRYIIPISAKQGEGIDGLLSAVNEVLGFVGCGIDGELITNARQAAALAHAAERAEAALYAAQCGMTTDAVVMDAEGAIAALGEITGETVTEAVVEQIFSHFCVGK